MKLSRAARSSGIDWDHVFGWCTLLVIAFLNSQRAKFLGFLSTYLSHIQQSNGSVEEKWHEAHLDGKLRQRRRGSDVLERPTNSGMAEQPWTGVSSHASFLSTYMKGYDKSSLPFRFSSKSTWYWSVSGVLYVQKWLSISTFSKN